MAGHTYHGSRLRALSPQVEACSGCIHCSGKPSNRTKLPDTMGNRRRFPTPGLPNPVATSLVEAPRQQPLPDSINNVAQLQLNYYDNFSSIVFLANSTPINLNLDTPSLKHLNDFINNMRPAQRSTGTSSASEWFSCLTEEEHQHGQQHQHLQPRPFECYQQQKPTLHNDAISALNYLIYVGSTSTTSETILPNTPNRQHPLSLLIHPHPNRQQHLVKVPSTSWLRRAGTIIRSTNSATNNRVGIPHQHHHGSISGNARLHSGVIVFRPATSSISTW